MDKILQLLEKQGQAAWIYHLINVIRSYVFTHGINVKKLVLQMKEINTILEFTYHQGLLLLQR